MLSFSNMSMSGFATLKVGDNLFAENQSRSFYRYEYIDGNWLFNSASPKFNFVESYGKCLYLLKLKIKEESNSFY